MKNKIVNPCLKIKMNAEDKNLSVGNRGYKTQFY